MLYNTYTMFCFVKSHRTAAAAEANTSTLDADEVAEYPPAGLPKAVAAPDAARTVLSTRGKAVMKEWATQGEGAAALKQAANSALSSVVRTLKNLNDLNTCMDGELARLKLRMTKLEAAQALGVGLEEAAHSSSVSVEQMEEEDLDDSDDFDAKYFYPVQPTAAVGTGPWTAMHHALSSEDLEKLVDSIHASPPRRSLLGKRSQCEGAGACGGLPTFATAAMVSPLRPTPRRAGNIMGSPLAAPSPPPREGRLGGGRNVKARTSAWSGKVEKGHPIFRVTTTVSCEEQEGQGALPSM
jgi:hypothetical protein